MFLSGIQALVRLLLDQHRADLRRGLHTGTLVSGLSGLAARRPRPGARGARRAARRAPRRRPLPGAQRGARRDRRLGQPAGRTLPGARYDGVLGVWYGKAPGLDRAADALRHGNFVGVVAHRRRGSPLVRRRPRLQVLDDARAPPSRCWPSLHMPALLPGRRVQEVLDLGLPRLSPARARPGLWAGLKIVTSVADAVGDRRRGARARCRPCCPTLELADARRPPPNGNLLPPRVARDGAHAARRPHRARARLRARERRQPRSERRARRLARHRRRRASRTTTWCTRSRDLGARQRCAGMRIC